MAIERYGIYPCLLNAAVALLQVDGINVEPGKAFDEITPGGAVDRAGVILSGAAPVVRIMSQDLKTIFTSISPSVGLNCTGSSTFQYQQRASGAVFSGGSTFVKAVATAGFVFPDSVSADGNSPARCSLTFLAMYDGTNAPLVYSASNAVVGSAPAFTSQYYLGPLYVNTVLIDGLISASVNFGLSVMPIKPDGMPYPSFPAVVARKPVFTFTFLKLGHISATIGSLQNALLAGNLIQHFRRGVSGGVRENDADTSDSHIRFTAASGAWAPDAVQVTGEGDATVTVTVRPTAVVAVGQNLAIAGT